MIEYFYYFLLFSCRAVADFKQRRRLICMQMYEKKLMLAGL